ncbi:MAG: ATP-dependent Clp protease adapter ClpS [Pikeienuella sp.]
MNPERQFPKPTRAADDGDDDHRADDGGRKGGADTAIIAKPKSRTQRPSLYKVMLLNDDYTPMEFVVHVLERIFGMTNAQAVELMLTVHRRGLAVVGVFSFEVAETKVTQVMEYARRNEHPLQCTMEKE